MILQLMVLVKLNLFLLDHFWFQSPVYGGNQLVLYDPVANDDGEIGPIPTQPLHLQSPAYILCSTIRQETSLNGRHLESILPMTQLSHNFPFKFEGLGKKTM
uniref:Uncharacterized protein n=1 Tax=Rhizophora mucronata TaxID=61149 RepID=A0A2P2P079_RHIMU